MKNRKMLRNLAALGVVTCVVSNNLQIPLKALTEFPHSTQADATTLEVLEDLSEDVLHVSLESTITSYKAGSILGKFSITGVNSSDAQLVLEDESKDNHKFAIENNILKSKVDLVPGTSYIIEVLCMDESFIFHINTPSEEVLSPEGEGEVLPPEGEGGEGSEETLPPEDEGEEGSEEEVLPPEGEGGEGSEEALPPEGEGEEGSEEEVVPPEGEGEEGSEEEALPPEGEGEEGSEEEVLPPESEGEEGSEEEVLPPEGEGEEGSEEEALPPEGTVDVPQPIAPEEVIEGITQAFNKEDVYANALVNYVLTGEERVFDGTKTIDKTIDKDKIQGLSKGTIIIKAKFNPQMASGNGVYPIIGFGSSVAQETGNTKAQLVGLHRAGSSIPRYEFTDGLYSSCAKNVNYNDGQWHVLALVFDDANIFVSGDGQTTLDGANGHYASAKYNGFLTRNPGINSITIGGIVGTKSNSNKVPYQNWVGEIAQVTITDQILTKEQANELTLAAKGEVLEVTLDGNSVDFGVVGAEVGTFIIKGEEAQTATVSLKEATADNDKFIVENNVLKTKEALEPASTYRVVAICNGEEFEFVINSKIDTNLPIIKENSLLSFENGALEGSQKNYNDTVINQVKLLQDMTLKFQFKQNQSGIGSLFSFSDSKQTASHFHLYANGSEIGYEMRMAGSNDSNKVAKLRSNGVNTVAFKADSQTHTYKLFVNGELVFTKEMTPETYKMASHIAGIDTVSLGRTARSSGNTYPYTGLIGEAVLESKALSDEELIAYTSQTEAISKEALADQPFVAGDEFGSDYFRIPALTELKNGDIMAAMDIRFGSTFDSPNNLDTGVRIKRQGSWEEAQLVNHFTDYVDEGGRPTGSASFIDPAVVHDPDSGRIYMLADAFPSGGGLFGQYNNMYGNGMVKINESGQRVTDEEEGTYYVGLVSKGIPLTNGMEMTHYIKPVESTNPDVAYEIIEIATNKKTNYTLNKTFEVFKDYQPLTVAQKRANGSLSGVDVPMSIFYESSEFLLYPVAHLWLVTSDDNGVTWNAPKLIANEFKTKEMRYFIAGPGRGHIVENGPYAGRILFPMYSDLKGERSSVIYSDDKGDTWHHSEITTMTNEPGKSPGKSSEAQLIELPDGTIRIYARSQPYVNYVGYADSLDGGATFEPMQIEEGFQFASNVQLSVINYSRKIDGKHAIILSAPEGQKGSNQRTKGRIHVGLINENPSATGYDKYTIDWKYTYEVNNTSYGYSCLAELPNGDIAVLYEGDGVKPVYEEIPMDRILGKVAKPKVAVINPQQQLVGGKEVELAISTKERVVASLSDLQNSVLDITFEGIEAPTTTATFKEISAEGTNIVYTLSLPVSSEDYTLHASLNEGNSLVTLDEVLQLENVASLSATVYAQPLTTTYDIVTDGHIVGGEIHTNTSAAMYGDKVEVSVVAEEGFTYKPDSLKVNGVEVMNNAFIMPNEDVTLTAEFVKHNYSITVSESANGIVKSSKTLAKEGDTITIAVTPNAGYEVESIRVNGSDIEGTTFTMPSKDTVVSVVFKAQDTINHNIYVTQSKNGKIQLAQTQVAEGSLVHVQVIPDEGYELYQMQVDGAYIDGTSFTMPNHNVTLYAEFVVASEKPQVSTPIITATGSELDSSRVVTIETATEGATIYYTTDGTVPTQESLVYKEGIQVDKTTTIWAIAVKEGMKDSSIATLEVVVTPEKLQVSTPIITATGSELDSSRVVTIETATEGATIYYTTDGTVPTQESLVYKDGIQVDKTTTFRAIAVKEGMKDSSIATLEVVVTPEKLQVSTPIITATGSELDSSRVVTIETATEGTTIYYTTDGTVPTQESLVYKDGIQVDKTTTFRAIAVKEGMKDSSIATLEVVVTPATGEKPKPEEKPSTGAGTSSSTSSSTQTKSDYKVEIEGTTTKLIMKVKVNKAQDTASLTLSKIELLKAMEDAINQAAQKGILEAGIVIEFVIDIPFQTLSALEVVFPQGLQEYLLSNNIQSIIFVNELANISLDLDAIKEISETIEDEFVLHLKEVEQSQLSLYKQKLFSNKPVFDLVIQGRNNNKSINFLERGSIAISMPYALDVHENVEHISAVAINSGALVNIEDVTYDEVTQTVEVKMPYCTRVAISYEPPSGFKDISSHWAKNDIELVTRLGIFGGTKVDTFSPDAAMTRGMFVTVLGRLAQVDSNQYTVASSFKDIHTKMYYAPYVNWATSKGIAKGMNDITFGAKYEVTREQVAVMIVNYLEHNNIILPVINEEVVFEDDMKISSYAKEAVKQMQMAGILLGKSNNQFEPQGKATRAEIATLLKRLISIVESTK